MFINILIQKFINSIILARESTLYKCNICLRFVKQNDITNDYCSKCVL